MNENNIFLNWYKQRFTEVSEELPGDLWNNISNELDVAEVWTNVDKKLTLIEKQNIFRRRIIFTLSIASILMLVLSPISIFNGNKIKVENGIENSQNISQNIQSNSISNNSISPLKPDKKNSFNLQKTEKIKVQNNSISTNNRINNISKIDYQKPNSSSLNSDLTLNTNVLVAEKQTIDTIEKIQPKMAFLSNPIEIKMNFVDSTYNYPTKISKQKTEFYVGGIYSINNTWLLNNSTFEGLSGNSLSQTNINFTNNFGLSLGCYTNKINVELNGNFNVKQTQEYQIYDEGRYISKHIELNYSFFNISFKHIDIGYCKWLNIPYTRNIITGVNFSFLKDGNEHSNNNIEQIKSLYHNNDYGFRFGYEYEINVFKRFNASAAIISDLGLKNIFKGNTLNPDYFYRTHTATVRLNFGVKYLLFQK